MSNKIKWEVGMQVTRHGGRRMTLHEIGRVTPAGQATTTDGVHRILPSGYEVGRSSGWHTVRFTPTTQGHIDAVEHDRWVRRATKKAESVVAMLRAGSPPDVDTCKALLAALESVEVTA
jgi:hypothetical protein